MGLFRTNRNYAALFCRIALAAVFIPHGMDKLMEYEMLGWRGPEFWAAHLADLIPGDMVTPQYKLLLSQIAAWAEVVAGGAMVLGLLVRVAVIPLIIDMSVAIALVHARNGYWITHTLNGAPAPGFEYCMVLILISMGLFFSGAGSLSLDKFIGGDDEDEYIEYEYIEEVEPPAR